ncbi:hypothetical protein IAU60_003235 [Kwoniella sp. DSM 27419]
MPITPLPTPTSTTLRSSVIVPTFSQVLSELLQNSLDAGATGIDVSVSLARSNETIRVEDDGCGITAEGLKKVGKRFRTSKAMIESGTVSARSYGFRGEALSSIAAMSLLSITSRTAESSSSQTKIMMGSKVVFSGIHPSRSIPRGSGTSVTVKEIFHNVPVRRQELAQVSEDTLMRGCRKVVEVLALAKPGIHWRLSEEREDAPGRAGTMQRTVLDIRKSRNAVDVFRSIHGGALVKRVQNIRVSAGSRRVDGFISLSGSITKGHQYLYVNHLPVEKGELHLAVSKRFATSRFAAFATSGDADDVDLSCGGRRSPRQLEQHPIYVLNVTLPSSEVDALYEPRKGVLGYKDFAAVKALLLAVIDEYLSKNGFTPAHPAMSASPSPTKSVFGASPIKSSLSHDTATALHGQSPLGKNTIKSRSTLRSSAWDLSRPSALDFGLPAPRSVNRPLQDLPPTPAVTPTMAQPAEVRSDLPLPERIAEASTRKHRWIADLQESIGGSVLPMRGIKRSIVAIETTEGEQPEPHSHTLFEGTLTPIQPPMLEVQLSKASLSQARVVGQVDLKYIAVMVPLKAGHVSMVLIDQHAADERVSCERILSSLCRGFRDDTIPVTKLTKHTPRVLLTLAEAEELARPGFRRLLRRWGIHLSGWPEAGNGENNADYVQIPVEAVPAELVNRLGKKESVEVTRLLRGYLPVLAEHLGEAEALLRSYEHDRRDSVRSEGARAHGDDNDDNWGKELRLMPREMLELANSKACRGAIMFQDRLDRDQCERLVSQLGQTRFPFVCAHGRPSMVPVVAIQPEGSPAASPRRCIDWAAQKRFLSMASGRDKV